MRLPWPTVTAAVLAVAVGTAGLLYGAVPQSSATPPPAPGAVTIADAYVRAPVSLGVGAAAYFTVYNTTSRPDRLISVSTGAGTQAMLHTSANGTMTPLPNGAVVPAHGKLVLEAGAMHVMITHLLGTLKPGQTVNIEADFTRAGSIDVTAKVIAYGATPPHGAPVPDGSMTMDMKGN